MKAVGATTANTVGEVTIYDRKLTTHGLVMGMCVGMLVATLQIKMSLGPVQVVHLYVHVQELFLYLINQYPDHMSY